jgi:hypothetical protein
VHVSVLQQLLFCTGVDLVVRPTDLNITEGGVMEVCVEFAEGQIPAERLVILTVSETSSMSLFNVYFLHHQVYLLLLLLL